MKILTKMFFCTFAIALFYSCEPEELSEDYAQQQDVIAETGDQDGDVVYKDDL